MLPAGRCGSSANRQNFREILDILPSSADQRIRWRDFVDTDEIWAHGKRQSSRLGARARRTDGASFRVQQAVRSELRPHGARGRACARAGVARPAPARRPDRVRDKRPLLFVSHQLRHVGKRGSRSRRFRSDARERRRFRRRHAHHVSFTARHSLARRRAADRARRHLHLPRHHESGKRSSDTIRIRRNSSRQCAGRVYGRHPAQTSALADRPVFLRRRQQLSNYAGAFAGSLPEHQPRAVQQRAGRIGPVRTAAMGPRRPACGCAQSALLSRQTATGAPGSALRSRSGDDYRRTRHQ